MELWQEILISVLHKENISITFPDIKESMGDIIDNEAYKALEKIKAVLRNDSIQDKECFMQIEAIVVAFEGIGVDCGGRHDF